MAGLAWFLALVLASSALAKLRERERLALATARLTGLGAAPAGALALVVAALEALAALALLLPATQGVGAVIAAAIWLAYGVALFAARARGDSLDCGCSPARRAKPVDRFMIGRAFGLAALAGLALAAALVGVTSAEIEPLFAALGLFTLYTLAGEIAALPPRRRIAR